MNHHYLLLGVVVLSWSLIPFLRKFIVKKLDVDEMMIVSNIFYFVTSLVAIFLYLIYLIYSREKDIFQFWKKLNTRDYLILSGVSVIGIIAGLSFTKLLKEHSATFLRAHTEPLVLLFSLVFGYFIFQEEVTTRHFIGGAVIIAGITIFNWPAGNNS